MKKKEQEKKINVRFAEKLLFEVERRNNIVVKNAGWKIFH